MRSRISNRLLVAAGAILLAAPALAADAARVGDPTSHGGAIVPPGAPNVFIEGRPAARATDQVSCPLFNGPVPHAGGPIVTGSATVRINGLPAARVGDIATEVGATSAIVAGAPTVRIGN
jgi:uncharacterized Zn-binding protein involved in type VI secretion